MSNNIILSYPNRADGATFSGGSWEAALPVSNLANRELWKVARSTDALVTSTKFNGDLQESRLLRAIALVNHNLSASATWRVSIGSTAGASDVYAGGWVAVWQMQFDALVEWGSAVWWGVPGGDEYLRSPFPALCDLGEFFSARYLTIEINDTANVDGYVQLGRPFFGGGLQPTYNAAYGLQDYWRDLSTKEYSESGAQWATARRRLRGVSFSLDWITHAEAAYLHDMQRQIGTIDEVLYIPYPTDMGASQRYGFVGALSELSPIAYPYPTVRSLPLKIEELG